MNEALWNRLREASLVAGDPPGRAAPAPWYIRLMLGVAAWISAGLLLCSFGLAFSRVFGAVTFSVIGFVLCLGATFLFRLPRTGEFVHQLAFAASLVGTALFQFIAVQLADDSASAIPFTLALTMTVLFFAIPDGAHRIWAASVGICALCVGLIHDAPPEMRGSVLHVLAGASSLMLAGFWTWEFKHLRNISRWRPAAYGVTTAFLLLNAMAIELLTVSFFFELFYKRDMDVHSLARIVWIGLNGIALLWTAWAYLRKIPAGNSRCAWGLGVLVGILALAHLKLVFLGPCLMLMLLGRGQGNRLLMGVGVLALLFCLGRFYYVLEITLLQKSLYMMASAGALLLARYALLRLWPRDGEVLHA
ncbi:MAG: DUF4401 domain-containing protein [Azoarcus sp.]|jgi:hypothetical protein|nr:DUF4401 domain-containing protein [Azoarcus sp.]